MSLDTKYRPKRFAEVLGQMGSIKILKGIVKKGVGFRQSYLIAGPWGSGKTTLGRILARVLLCDNPQDGEPCDHCPSCVSFLTTGGSEDFVEFDAATNSGKEDIKKITENLEYTTFSGKRTIYLVDEAHRLSTSALDALLKPLEENIPGSDDKKMICIFCTTEPEKMRATILSRCAPAFVVEPVVPQVIVGRLAAICDAEGISYEQEMLHWIVEATECHIRDAMKAVEGISTVGEINRENVVAYLGLDQHEVFMEVLCNLEENLDLSLEQMVEVLKRVSPITCYEKFSDLALLAYRHHLGITKAIPVYWPLKIIEKLSATYGDRLLDFAQCFASRPARPSEAMLLCDLARLGRGGSFVGAGMVAGSQKGLPKRNTSGKIKTTTPDHLVDGVHVDPRARRVVQPKEKGRPDGELSVDEFCTLLVRKLRDHGGILGGLSRRSNMGSDRAIPPGGDEG